MTRIESDSMGEIQVPNDALWGAQTQRSLNNFHISSRTFSSPFLNSIIELKRACAIANMEFGEIPKNIGDAIVNAADQLLKSDYMDHFPLDIYQTGSGTQTNMNVNEVLSNKAIQILGGQIGSKNPVHPNDHVNKGQSSNDVIPSSMHISALYTIKNDLLPSLDYLLDALRAKQNEFFEIIKIGRTHLQDAVPLSVGQEFSGYVSQLVSSRKHIEDTIYHLEPLAIGGTAVGTGLNAHPYLDKRVCEILNERLNLTFRYDRNKFALIASKDAILAVSGALRMLAVALMKISNDIRWMASGPRSGLGELTLPANEPGSSIMPGKINPTQNEMLIQVAAQVIGNDTAITTGAQWGYMELNLMKPMMISNLLETVAILSTGMRSFTDRAVQGIEVNKSRLSKLVSNSLMLVTALTKHPKIGYDMAAKIAKKAFEEGKTIREILISDNILPEEEIESSLDLTEMIHLDRTIKE